MNKKNYLILTGGTGGHVIPAVNFGNFIIEKGHDCSLLVDERGKKYADSFKGRVRIINSSHFSHNFLGKVQATFSLISGFFQSWKFLINIRPYSCISFGSYATFVPLSILVFFRFFGFTKIFLHEQNSVMGKVNLLFTPFANKIFLNFDKTFKLKNSFEKKSYLVGFPFDHKIQLKDRNININNKKYIRVFICGGSQGAVSLNKIMIDLFNKFPKSILNRIEVSIQCPEIQKKEIDISFNKLLLKYELRYFFDNFIEKLYESDILITRAGAGTVNDVILTQIPTIFIPLPSSANNHQFYNANYLKLKKAALLIEQKDLNSERSLSTIIELINNFNQQINLIKNLQEIKSFDTNQLIFKHINEEI